MIPREKIKAIVVKHDSIEKELSSGNIDPKTYANKSKEYSDLGNIISYAKSFLSFDQEKKDLEQIIVDKGSDAEMVSLAEKELISLNKKKVVYENKLKIFLLPKDADDQKGIKRGCGENGSD